MSALRGLVEDDCNEPSSPQPKARNLRSAASMQRATAFRNADKSPLGAMFSDLRRSIRTGGGRVGAAQQLPHDVAAAAAAASATDAAAVAEAEARTASSAAAVEAVDESDVASFAAEFDMRQASMGPWQYETLTADGGVALSFQAASVDHLQDDYDKLLRPLGAVDAPAGEAAAEASKSMTALSRDASKSIRVSFLEGKMRPVNIVMLVVGTRGDVQPFIGIGLKLKEYGHRVRLASHAVYREFVTSFGLEFYPLGGDPKVLSEFVVKHRGIMPGWDVSDALAQRVQVKAILHSTWGACTLPDPESPSDLFTAEAIVANPPAYGHTHCAEKLNVPLHIVFTMPWYPTKYFPNPFARVDTSMGRTDSKAKEAMNRLSYLAVEDLAWLGQSAMVQDFRRNVLELEEWTRDQGPHALFYSQVPMTYIWSPSLVARPDDWPSHCEVVGFVNVDLQTLTNYEPPQELVDFLAAGPPPVYIGFGSLVVEDPEKLTRKFLDAIEFTGLRAIIQKGWGGLGAGITEVPEDVLLLGPAAHDWLFPRCCAVVHHGGAGTTSCGLHCGKPTFIVPFFGDQPFWGAACHAAGVGPPPVPIDDLTTAKIVDAFKTLIMPACQKKAKMIQARMLKENGIQGTVDHIHRSVYGALLADQTFGWLAKAATRMAIRSEGALAEGEAEGEDFDGRQDQEQECDEGWPNEPDASGDLTAAGIGSPDGVSVGGSASQLSQLSRRSASNSAGAGATVGSAGSVRSVGGSSVRSGGSFKGTRRTDSSRGKYSSWQVTWDMCIRPIWGTIILFLHVMFVNLAGFFQRLLDKHRG